MSLIYDDWPDNAKVRLLTACCGVDADINDRFVFALVCRNLRLSQRDLFIITLRFRDGLTRDAIRSTPVPWDQNRQIGITPERLRHIELDILSQIRKAMIDYYWFYLNTRRLNGLSYFFYKKQSAIGTR